MQNHLPCPPNAYRDLLQEASLNERRHLGDVTAAEAGWSQLESPKKNGPDRLVGLYTYSHIGVKVHFFLRDSEGPL